MPEARRLDDERQLSIGGRLPGIEGRVLTERRRTIRGEVYGPKQEAQNQADAAKHARSTSHDSYRRFRCARTCSSPEYEGVEHFYIEVSVKLLVAGIEPPDQIGSWSGTPYHLVQALSRQFDLCFEGGLRGGGLTLHRVAAKVHDRLRLGAYRIRSEPSVLKAFSRRLDETISRESPDAIISMGCEPIAFLGGETPAYIVHDSTFRQLSGVYPHFQHLSKASQKSGEIAQVRGFARATATFAASHWAKNSACNDYGLPSEKVNVVPMGANLVDPPTFEEISHAIERRIEAPVVEFLFIGVEWERKGGDAAVAIVEALTSLGLPTVLHIVGCTPPAYAMAKPFVRSHGFLSKRDANEKEALDELLFRSRFFLTPSVAECYGCVFCEASAFGVPSIARAVGGITEIVRSGETGLLLSPDLSFEALVEQVLSLSRDPKAYRQMAWRARADFETRLNWTEYVRRLSEVVRK
jgi:glycosyltransferase involved in cell wall biosynthesis